MMRTLDSEVFRAKNNPNEGEIASEINRNPIFNRLSSIYRSNIEFLEEIQKFNKSTFIYFKLNPREENLSLTIKPLSDNKPFKVNNISPQQTVK